MRRRWQVVCLPKRPPIVSPLFVRNGLRPAGVIPLRFPQCRHSIDQPPYLISPWVDHLFWSSHKSPLPAPPPRPLECRIEFGMTVHGRFLNRFCVPKQIAEWIHEIATKTKATTRTAKPTPTIFAIFCANGDLASGLETLNQYRPEPASATTISSVRSLN